MTSACRSSIALTEPAPAPEPPLEGCEPGTPCGFATIVTGLTSQGDVEDTGFRRFDLAHRTTHGSQFAVDPDRRGRNRLRQPWTSLRQPRDDGYEDLVSRGAEDGT